MNLIETGAVESNLVTWTKVGEFDRLLLLLDSMNMVLCWHCTQYSAPYSGPQRLFSRNPSLT